LEKRPLDTTRRLVDFILDTNYEDIPKDVMERAKMMILDNLGVQLAAAAFPLGKIIKGYLNDQGGREQSTVVGLGLKTSCTNAAWANATLAHGLDNDDGDLSGVHAHPTSKTLPSTLSVGEFVKANGKEALVAFVLGTEAQIRIASMVEPSHFDSGFHTAGTVGTFGAVVTAGKLLGLDADQMLNAFGIAGSAAAGLKINFGSMVKGYHAGHAAEQGVKAALLGKRGWKATKKILEGRSGFCQVMSREYDMKKDVVLQGLGEHWDMLDPGIYFKRYAGCGALTSICGVIISMAKRHDINPNDVALVEVGTDASLKVSILTYSKEVDGLPTDAYEARYSVPAAVAISIIRRKAGIEDITDEIVQDPKTVQLMKKVKHYIDPQVRRFRDFPNPRQTFKIKMQDGREYFETIEPSKPLPKEAQRITTREEVLAKYKKNAKLILCEDKIEKAVNIIDELEKIDDIRTLAALVAGK
jgi:2-methylcitrate dehydratase PrpD